MELRSLPTPFTARRIMKANYGYEDGSGFYYITIDGDVCASCADRGCVGACPEEVYVIEVDDYDDHVAVVREDVRKRLRETCAACKGEPFISGESPQPPCVVACAAGALKHSW